MCLFCCDMLCWFSLITCCGCRDMVTRRLVFFPPEPYYNQTDRNEKFKDFYHRLQPIKDNENDDEKDIKIDDNNNDKDIILEVGNKKSKSCKPQTEHQQNEMEALNSSDDTTTSDELKIKTNQQNNKRKRSSNDSSSIDITTDDITPEIYGTFRIKDDDINLAQFYKSNYNIDIKNFKSQYLTTKRGEKIASYYIKHPSAEYTILFSHGNAADIGLMRNHLCRMYEKCKVSIFAYEYSGYGRSSGKPSEKNTYCDIETAYKYCVKNLSIQPSRIIAYGQSLGTCVSVYLASQFPVGGVILHSPLMSGLRVMQHFDKTYWFDIYPVVEQIQQVFATVWVIHGNKDKEIDPIHGKILSRLAPNSYPPWFVPYAGHNDIEVLFPDALFKKIHKFIKYLKTVEQNCRNQEYDDDLYDENDDRFEVTDDHRYGTRAEEEEEEDDDDDDDDEDEEDQTNDDTEIARYKKAHLMKSVTQKNPDQSISPPPPQSIMTKSGQDRITFDSVNTKNRLPSRKFSNTGNSMLDDEESVLKTPSVAASLSMKDSNFISMSIKDDKSTNKNYDQVLTPTMRTIHSKEQSTSEILTLDNKINIDESQTMSTFHIKHKAKRGKIRNVISSHPGIDELDDENEVKGDEITMTLNTSNKRSIIHKRKRKRKKKINNNKPLILPKSTNMRENIKHVWKRRDNLPMDDNEDSSDDSSTDDDDDDEDDDNDDDNTGDDEDDDDDDDDSSDDIDSDNNNNNDNDNKKDIISKPQHVD